MSFFLPKWRPESPAHLLIYVGVEVAYEQVGAHVLRVLVLAALVHADGLACEDFWGRGQGRAGLVLAWVSM